MVVEELLESFVKRFLLIEDQVKGLHPNQKYGSRQKFQEITQFMENFFVFSQSTLTAGRLAEIRYRALFQAARSGIFIVDYDSASIIDANQRAEDLTLFSVKEMVGKHPRNLQIHTDAEFGEIRQSVLEQIHGKDVRPFGTVIRRTDGSTIQVEVTASLAEMRGQKFVFVVFQDITWRKQMEIELKMSEETARTLLDATPDSVFLLDPNLTILATNKTARENFHSVTPVFRGKPFLDLFNPQDPRNALRNEKLGGIITTGEHQSFQDENAGRKFEVNLYPVKDMEGKICRIALYAREIIVKN